jgi:carbonic anhydrase/acetyltransferase-like protein (isoleucine patch superfamily)
LSELLSYKGILPTLGEDAYVAPGARVIGDVVLGDGASVWFNSVVRGDVMPIRIGARTNIQDLSVLHVSSETFATTIGDDVTVGHRAIIHGCTIEDRCLIGMGAIILDGAYIEEGCLIAAGALVPPGVRVPAGSVYMGAPGKVRRQVSQAELENFLESAKHYSELARVYANER